MKMKHLTTLLLAVLLGLTTVCRADEKDEPKVEVKIPDTADALWSEIDAKDKALGEVVTSKDTKTVYVAAETVEALVRAIPDKYPDLAGDKKKRVEGQVKNIARVLDELHDTAKEGHWDVAAKKLGQVEAALKIMRGQVGK